MKFPSNDELDYVKKYTLLPYVLRVFQYDLKAIQESSVKFKEPYRLLIEQGIRKIEQDYINTKKSLRQVGLKIYDEKITETSFDWKYLYRGYHHTFSYSSDVLKNEVKKCK